MPKVRTVVPGNDGRSEHFLMQVVKEGIQKGEFHSSLGPEAAVDAIVAMVRGLSFTYVRSRLHGTSSSPIPYVAGSKIVETRTSLSKAIVLRTPMVKTLVPVTALSNNSLLSARR